MVAPPPLTSPESRETAGHSYSMRIRLIAREITSCWICSVPSKMSMAHDATR